MYSRILEVALSQYGIKEVPGPENNPEILKYFHAIGQTWVQSETTAWCSAFINWCAQRAGYEYSGKLNARSWLNLGKACAINEADIVVLWRESPSDWRGHVGVPIREDGDVLWVLGGNQSNMVRISAYPRDRVLKYIKLYPA